MELKVIEQYKSEEGDQLYDVRIGEETFKGIKPIKLDEQKCRKCPHYNDYGCCQEGHVVRAFDCRKKVQALQNGFNGGTGLMAGAMALFILNLQIAFLTKIGFLIAGVVILDVVSATIQKLVPRTYNWFFYRKQKKIKAKNERLEAARRKAEENLKQKKEAERLANERYYEKVQKARVTVKELRNISDKHDYGPNEEKISTCVELCETMLQKLEEDTSSYLTVKDLFEVYIPGFMAALEDYVELANTDTDMEEQEKALIECVDIVLQYVEKKAQGDQETAKTMFTASTNALKNQLRNELDKS